MIIADPMPEKASALSEIFVSHALAIGGIIPIVRAGIATTSAQVTKNFAGLNSASMLPAIDIMGRFLVLEASSSASPSRGLMR